MVTLRVEDIIPTFNISGLPAGVDENTCSHLLFYMFSEIGIQIAKYLFYLQIFLYNEI